MSDQEALPGPGQTTPTPRVDVPRDPTHLTLEEAARDFDTSVPTLRRWVKEGKLAGAKKSAGPSGDRWVVPVEVIERHFRRRAEPQQEQGRPVPEPVSVHDEVIETLRAVIERDQGLLEAAREDRERLHREKEDARVEAASLAAALDAERRMTSDLRERLADAEARGWFARRRRRKEKAQSSEEESA